MLFFYSTSSSTHGPFSLAGVRCANCAAAEALAIVILTRYVHFF